MRPREAVIAVTYRCNSRCSMCNIWKESGHVEIEPNQYLKLPDTLRTINITGGEPFLRKDLTEIIKNIHSVAPHSRIVFSTNGYLTDQIVSTMNAIRPIHSKVGVGVSIDGSKATHDRIRGVSGIYERAKSTIEELKGTGLKDLRIGMTLLPENVNEVHHVFDLADSLGVEFTTTYAHNSEIYFQKVDNVPPEAMTSRASLSRVLDAQLRSRSPKEWFRAYHLMGIMDPEFRAQFTNSCEAGRRYFFMSPSGDIYPCMVLNQRIGNIRDVASWDELFTSEIESRFRGVVRRCKEDCWMVCNTRSLIIAHPFKVSSWVAVNKIRAHLRS